MLLDVTVIITVVCNYKVYPQNSCSVEDDQRGVSVCLNICFKAEGTLQPTTPYPAATILVIHSPKLCCNRPQGPVLVSDCFLLYPFQLETNRWEQVIPWAPLFPSVCFQFLTSQALSRTCLPVLLPLLCVRLVSA